MDFLDVLFGCHRKSCDFPITVRRTGHRYASRITAVVLACVVGGRPTGNLLPANGARAIRVGYKRRIAAKAETTGYRQASHRAFDSQPRGRLH